MSIYSNLATSSYHHRKSVNFDRINHNLINNNHYNKRLVDLSNLNRKSEMFSNENRFLFFQRDLNRFSAYDRTVPWIGKITIRLDTIERDLDSFFFLSNNFLFIN